MDEYISKSYLITKFNELADKYAGNEHKRQRALAYATAADMIKLMDAADVQPVKHGKWVEHINHRYDYDREQGDLTAGVSYTCSLCNAHGIKGWRFCHSCGARMIMDGDTNG